MSARSSSRKKAKLSTPRKATSDTLDVTTSSNADNPIANDTQQTAEVQMEADEQSSSSTQPTDNSNGMANESDGKENGTVERGSGSDRLTKRHITKSSEVDKEPEGKRRKQTKDMQPSTVAKKSLATSFENGSKLPEQEEAWKNGEESQMEIDGSDEMVEENTEEAYTDTGSDIKSTLITEPVIPGLQQMQTPSTTIVHSSADGNDIWQPSNVAGNVTPSDYFVGASSEPRRRAMTPQVREEIIDKHPETLQAYSGATIPPAVVDDTPKPVIVSRHQRQPRIKKLLLTITVFVCVVVAYRVLFGGQDGNENTPAFKGVKSFLKLRDAFPNQSERLWRIMEAATLPVLEEDRPTHPAVILLVAGKEDHPVAECLGRRYAALVTESHAAAAAHATFNCETAHSDPDDVKTQVDTTLSRAFDAGSKSGVVLRLEKLPGPAALIFYRFADNDNAPYKDVALVMTLALESTAPVTGREKDSVAYDELRKVWGSSLDTDKVEPLLSRIGNSVAFVRPEAAHILSENGC